jgi:hypothetical protein
MAGSVTTVWAHPGSRRWPTVATAARRRRPFRSWSAPRCTAAAWRRLVSAYIFISGSPTRLLAPLGLPTDRSFVKHNFVPAPSATDDAVEHQVAYVGRLDEAKGASS